YPEKETLHLIMDNLSTHLHPKVRRWARRNRIRLTFTPTNASWLNPIEPHFGGISEFVIKGSDYAGRAQLRREIQKYLRWRNANPSDERIKRAERKHQLCETRY
ncbi:MAG: transposase, partial [Candidatus Eisenbacteria bacterium]